MFQRSLSYVFGCQFPDPLLESLRDSLDVIVGKQFDFVSRQFDRVVVQMAGPTAQIGGVKPFDEPINPIEQNRVEDPMAETAFLLNAGDVDR